MSSIKRNSFYGLLGFAVPTAVMLVAYPVLVHRLGAEAFGVYLLATSISGVLAFLDFGFSAATLKFIAEDTARGDERGAADILVASLVFYGGLGATVALAVLAIAPWLIDLFAIRQDMQVEAVLVFRLAGVQFAVFMLITVFISLFKGLQRFEQSSLMLSVLSVVTYGGAALAVLVGNVGLVGVTAISLAAHILVLGLCLVVGRSIAQKHQFPISEARPSLLTFRRMFSFGAVMTVNSISGVFLYQIQQYLIGATIGPAAVSIYRLATTVPAKAHAVVNAVTEILFPFASATTDRTRLRQVYLRMLTGSVVIAFLALLPLAIFPQAILSIWIGSKLAMEVAPLLPLFAVAFFFLALSPAPYHLVNGLGKPWINTISYAFNAFANVVLIALFARDGMTLFEFAWAFTIANIVNSLAYQAVVEILVWRRARWPDAVAVPSIATKAS